MIKRIFLIISALLVSSSILFISILRSSSVRYSFNSVYAAYTRELLDEEMEKLDAMNVDYYLAYPGSVIPGNPLWYLKAARDKVWLLITTNEDKKAELNLLFADKRLGMALQLFRSGKTGLGFTTLTKAEKYLEKSSSIEQKIRARGGDTFEISDRLMRASILHVVVTEKIKLLAPEDAIPKINSVENITKNVYQNKYIYLKSKGIDVQENLLEKL